MIVTCERCATQFQLDDAKVPENGFRARCSRCDHSFTVESPRRPEADRAAELARDALTERRREPAGHQPGPGIEFETDSDWEFNDLAAGDAPRNPPDLEGPSVEVEGSAVEGVSPAVEAEGSAQPAEARSRVTAEQAVDSLLVGFESQGPEVGQSDPGASETNHSRSDELETGDPLAGLEIGDLSEALEEEFDEFGLDALGEEPLAPVQPSAAAQAAPQASPPPSRRQAPRPIPVAETAPSTSRVPRFESPVAVDREPRDARRRWARVGAIIGWSFVVVLLIAGLHGGFSGGQEDSRGAGQWSGAGFELDRIEGRWVDNAVAGPLYVVSGRIRRANGASTDPSTQLELRLVDRSGQTIDVPPAVVGPKLPVQILRESEPARIRRLQGQRAATFAAAAAAWVPFEAVVVRMPEAAARFELEAVAVEPDDRAAPAAVPVG